jgi:hypothetical protein
VEFMNRMRVRVGHFPAGLDVSLIGLHRRNIISECGERG